MSRGDSWPFSADQKMSSGSWGHHLAKELEGTQQQREWDRALQSHQSHLHTLTAHRGTFGGMRTAAAHLRQHKEQQNPPRLRCHLPLSLPRELSFSSHIPNATAPQRAQQRNCSGAARHPCLGLVCHHGTGTGLGTSAGLLSAPAFGTLRRGGRGWGVTRVMGLWQMLQQSEGPNFPHIGTKSSPCRAAVPAPQPRGGRPAHHLAREADFHKGIHQVLLVALEAEDLPDVVHDSVVHWEGKEMLRNHGSAGCSGCATAALHISMEPGGGNQFTPVKDSSPSTLSLSDICKVFGPRLWMKIPSLCPHSPAKATLTLGQIFGFEDLQAEMSPSQGDPGGTQEVALNILLVFRDFLLLQLQDNRTRQKHNRASQKS